MNETKPNTYDFWPVSAQKAYDAMQERAETAETKLEELRHQLSDSAGLPSGTDGSLSWHLKLIQMLNDLFGESSATLDPYKIFDNVAKIVCDFLEATSVYICDWNPHLKNSTILADYISENAPPLEHESYVGVIYQLDEVFEKRLLNTPEYWINYPDEMDLPHAEAFKYAKYDVKTSLFTPMYAEGELIGFIEVWDTRKKREFTQRQIDFIVTVTRQVLNSVRMAQLHRALVENEQRYQLLMNTMQSGLVQTDMNGIIQYANQHCLDLLHLQEDEVLYQPFQEVWEKHSKQTSISNEFRISEENNQPRWVTMNHAPLLSENNQPLGEVYIITDITKRRLAERDAIEFGIEKERMNLLTQFIQDASHEFFTPLSVINTKLYILNRYITDEELVSHLQSIDEQSRMITDLVRALVDLIKLDSLSKLSLRYFDLQTVLENAVSKCAAKIEAKQQIVHLDLQIAQTQFLCHPTSLISAIGKLIENAMQYTPEEGSIRISAVAQQDYIMLTIADTGIGMSDDVQSRMFERFYRADEARSSRGFGLGLPYAKRVIELHHGRINVTSAVDEGTTIQILLPQSLTRSNVSEARKQTEV